jgi:hypothetical protein
MSAPTDKPTPPEPSAPAPDKFGGPVDQVMTPLSAIAKDPAAFRGKTIATSGTVKRVCEHRGCWMAISAEGKDAMIRMHAHAFFVPPGASKGRFARVQGTVVLVKDGRECDESEARNAEIELDATGVELDPI